MTTAYPAAVSSKKTKVPADPEKPEKPGDYKLFLRAEKALVTRLDAWVEEIRVERPGFRGVTRTDLIRDILEKAVAEHEASKGKPKR